jgi:ribosomal-protein-alanine N-acetyltransferase
MTCMIYRLSDQYFVRGLTEADLTGPYPSWFEDQDVCRYNSHGTFPRTAAYFRDFVSGLNSEHSVVWAICHDSHGHIGNIALQDISLINRNAEFAIILGDRRHWGKGVSKLAAQTLLTHGFEKLNLERIHCATAAPNIAMRKLALALAMAEEGCRRRQLFLDGNWVDVIEFGVLRDEFRQAFRQ